MQSCEGADGLVADDGLLAVLLRLGVALLADGAAVAGVEPARAAHLARDVHGAVNRGSRPRTRYLQTMK